ncbi:MAG TPA: hypothetical protein VN937_13475 [Blastocatellia bacterium]|nr:hypothetical protein [Blastocatellia bacterium]
MFQIHNGESTAATLGEFGFPGEHYAFQEVLMAGPTPKGLSPDDWLTTRASYLIAAYDLNSEDCRNKLLKQEAALQNCSEHDETILWFEHDLFCQINLIYLLDWFSKRPPGKGSLSLICIGEFSGVEDFRGLGQLTGEQLASLFDKRNHVSKREFDLATQAWAAYCSTDPRDIVRLLEEDTSAMPFLRNALLLQLARFPSVLNGLGRIENTGLDLVSRGRIEFKSLFPSFAKREPLYGLGDAQFWNELKRLAEARNPLLTICGLHAESNEYHQASFELTVTGREVLACSRDFVELNGIDLWLGGVHMLDGDAVWRWNDDHTELLARSGINEKG